MPYLIDGHNLIPKIPGLNLAVMDDEEQLIVLLQTFSRVQRQRVEVYFDNAPAGHARQRNYGMVTAHFIRAGHSADDAILNRLTRLGNNTRGWIVVSSDHRIQNGARSLRVDWMSSDKFSNLLQNALLQIPQTSDEEVVLKQDEIEDWLHLFNSRHTPDA